MTWLLVLAWAAVLGLTAWWLWLMPQPDPPVIDLTDPYGAKVAQFRRELHDWDRDA